MQADLVGERPDRCMQVKHVLVRPEETLWAGGDREEAYGAEDQRCETEASGCAPHAAALDDQRRHDHHRDEQHELHPREGRETDEPDDGQLGALRRRVERHDRRVDGSQDERKRDRVGDDERRRTRGWARQARAAPRRAKSATSARRGGRSGTPAPPRARSRVRAPPASAGTQAAGLPKSQNGAASSGSSSAGKCAGTVPDHRAARSPRSLVRSRCTCTRRAGRTASGTAALRARSGRTCSAPRARRGSTRRRARRAAWSYGCERLRRTPSRCFYRRRDAGP